MTGSQVWLGKNSWGALNRWVGLFAALALVVAACGGGTDGGGEGTDRAISEGDQASETQDPTADPTASTSDESLGSLGLPDPGRAAVLVDGQTLDLSAAECQIEESGFGVAGGSDGAGGFKYQVMGPAIEGIWAITIQLEEVGGGATYMASGGSVEDPVIDGNVISLEAEFSSIEGDQAQAVGIGQMVINCG